MADRDPARVQRAEISYDFCTPTSFTAGPVKPSRTDSSNRSRASLKSRQLAATILEMRKDNARNADVLLHKAALIALRHAADHGDLTSCLDLLLALPTRDQNKLTAWFEDNGPISIDLTVPKIKKIDKRSARYKPFAVD